MTPEEKLCARSSREGSDGTRHLVAVLALRGAGHGRRVRCSSHGSRRRRARIERELTLAKDGPSD